MPLESSRLGALAAVKLRGLLGSRAGADVEVSGDRAVLHDDETVWVYQPRDADRALGPALVLAAHRGAPRLALVVDDTPPALRFALAGLEDRVSLHRAEGTELVAVDAEVAPSPEEPVANHPLVRTLIDSGLEVVAGHGIWIGEVHGLEVARLGASDRDLQLGVGAYDRGAFEALYPDTSPLDALPRVIAQVRDHRRAGAPPHLLNRLVRERWIRSILCADPTPVACTDLAAVAGLFPRPGLHTTVPDAAVGTGPAGRRLVVAAVGIDPNLVPTAAALAAREQVADVVLAVPTRDLHPVTTAAAGFLSVPTTVVGVDAPWS